MSNGIVQICPECGELMVKKYSSYSYEAVVRVPSTKAAIFFDLYQCPKCKNIEVR